MKFAIVSKGDDLSERVKSKMEAFLKEQQLQQDIIDPELVITIGGDGTLLRAVQQYNKQLHLLSFVGIHTGNLGFYADWTISEVDLLLKHIISQPINKVKYPLVELDLTYKDDKLGTERYIALNEVTVRGISPTVVFDVELSGTFFESFRGDGLCFSTPSGSTAYNKALGGTVIHPSIEVMQITEIASINNKVYRTLGSSVVLPKHHDCILKPLSDTELYISVDCLNFCQMGIKSLQLKVSKQFANFVRYRPLPFWKRVQTKFI